MGVSPGLGSIAQCQPDPGQAVTLQQVQSPLLLFFPGVLGAAGGCLGFLVSSIYRPCDIDGFHLEPVVLGPSLLITQKQSLNFLVMNFHMKSEQGA